ncbi:MAG: xylulokinase [Acidimicrobiales bacterium]
MSLVCGVDCSTQATKVVVVDPRDGRVVASGRSPHVVTGEGATSETDPVQWWAALGDAIAQTGRARDIDAISIAAQQHGLVLVDADSMPLRDAILWNDSRSAREAEDLIAALGGAASAADRVGSVPLAAFTVTSWMWVRRHEPSVAAAVRGIRLPHDWLNERLTGTATTDRGDVSATGWWSTATDDYMPDVLTLADVDIDPDLLPAVAGPSDTVGSVSQEAAAHLGLRTGVAVGPGTGDNPAAALALGLGEGELVVSLGTSGTVYTRSSVRSAEPTGAIVGLADATGHYLPIACTLNCTLAVDRVATWLGIDRESASDESRGVTVLPFLDGERTPYLPHASGAIEGLRHESTPGHILRAAYEGAGASLIEAIDVLDHHSSGVAADAPIILIGGGARGPLWHDVVAALSGRSLLVPDCEELVAMGAAVQAAAILDGTGVDEVAARWQLREGARVAAPPDGADTEVLARIRRVRSQLFESTGSGAG